MNWYDAKQHCIGLGGHLLEVRTQEDFDRAMEVRGQAGTIIWLGGYFDTVIANWVWASNLEEIDPTAFWLNSNPGHFSNLDCVALYPGYYYQYTSCTFNRPFACEFP